DTIHAYLAEAPISTSVLGTLGGAIGYWHQQEALKRSLARMGSDFFHLLYVIAAASVDGEQSFSVARRKLGFMQHNTSNQTFR
ncbi:hypothetical protein B0H13DRAFT_1465814, partial [Mycena leptocephala]